MKHKTTIMLIIILALLLAAPVLSAPNDPGHDILYVEQNGSSEINGSLNITYELKIADLLWSTHLYIMGNTSTPTNTKPNIYATADDYLYLNAPTGIYLAKDAGSTVYVGDSGAVDLTVSGEITSAGVAVCLANGTNCIGGNNSGNVTSVSAGNGISVDQTIGDVTVSLASSSAGDGLAYSTGILSVNTGTGLTTSGDNVLIDSTVCTTANGLCGGASSGGGWTNTSTTTSTDLDVAVNTNQFYVNTSSGNIGIGYTNPTYKLQVDGSINIGTNSFFGTTHAGTYFGTYGYQNTDTEIRTQNGYDILFKNGTNNEIMRMKPGGNIGIGTTAPTQLLDVNGSINVSGTSAKLYAPEICLAGDCQTGWPSGADGTGGWTNTSTTTSTSLDVNVTTGNLTVANGRVGIGTNTPSYSLDVQGDTFATDFNANWGIESAPSYTFVGDTGTGMYRVGSNSIGFTVGGSEAVVINESGYVGIGITTPIARLQIGDNTANTANRIVFGEYDAASQVYLPVIQQKSVLNSGTGNDLALGVTSNDGGILFYTGGTNAAQTLGTSSNDIRMIINKDGKVGIGTIDPNSSLHVIGTINASSDVCLHDGTCLSNTGAGDGNVSSSSTSTNNAIVRWDGATGLVIQNSGVTIDDNNDLTVAGGRVTGANSEYIAIGETNNQIDFYSNGATRLRVGTGNNVLIGSGSPGTATGDGDIYIQNDLEVDGTIYTSNNRPLHQSNSATITSSGWYRIAAAESGGRAFGIFNVMDTDSGKHNNILFTAGAAYPLSATDQRVSVNLLSDIKYSIEVLNATRIVTGGVYDPFYLEVYVESDGSTPVSYTLTNNDWTSGWTPIDWSAGSVPAGNTSTVFDMDDLIMNYDNDFVITTGGYVGVGTTNPSNELEVVGDIELTNLYDNDASNFFDGGACTYGISDIDSTGAFTCAAAQGAGDGNVSSSTISTDNAIPRWDGATGLIIQNSGVTIDDSNNLAVGGNIDLNSNNLVDIGNLYTNDASGNFFTGGCSDNQYVTGISSAGAISCSDNSATGSGNMNGFTVTADSGTDQDVNNSETLTFTGGTNITTVVGATNVITINHADTSGASGVDNSNGNVIQDIGIDGNGHLTGLTSYDLDNRYFTETESNTNFVSRNTWTDIDNYPTECGAGEAVRVIGDTLTCITVISTDVDTNASTACADDQYLDGSGTCTDIDNCATGSFLRYETASNNWICETDDVDDADASTSNEINTISADTGGTTSGLAITLSGGTGIDTARSTDTVTITLNDTGVAAANYGTSIAVADITIDAQGRITSASETTIRSATEGQTGVIELATNTEVNTGTDTVRAVVPSSLTAWTGSTTITTLGTIATGTWQATDIAVNQGGTGAATADGALSNLGAAKAATCAAGTVAQNTTTSGVQCVAFGSGDGNITGSGVSGRVTYWDGVDSITSNSGFTFDGTDLTLPGDINMPNAFYIGGGDLEASGSYAIAIGRNANVTGNSAAALGYNSGAIGDQSVAFGYYSQTNSDYTTSLGGHAITSGNFAVAIGYHAEALVYGAVAIGRQANATGGNSAIAIGLGSDATISQAIAIGEYSLASDYDAIAIGQNANSTGDQSVSIGSYARAIDNEAIAIGERALASNDQTVAIGRNTQATNLQTVALGYSANSTGTQAIAIGRDSDATGNEGVAIGELSQAVGGQSVAISLSANATGTQAIAIGYNSDATGVQSIALGDTAFATGDDAIAIGENAKATNSQSLALGWNSNSSGDDSISIGVSAYTTNTHSTAIGDTAWATAVDAIAIGANANSAHTESVALGFNAVTNAVNQLMVGASSDPLNTYIHGTLESTGIATFPTSSTVDGSLICTVANGYCNQTVSATGMTVWQADSDTNNPFNVVNNTLVQWLGGTSITTSTSSTDITIDVTDDTIDGTELADDIALDANLTIDGTTLTVDMTNDRVGIGLTAPIARLQIGDNTADTGNRIVLGEYESASQGYLPVIQQKSVLSAGASNDLALGTTSADAGILFYTGATNSAQTIGTASNTIRMTITKDGFVGINTTSPQTLFHVNGSSRFGGQVGIGTASPDVDLHIGDGNLKIEKSTDGTDDENVIEVNVNTYTYDDAANNALWDFNTSATSSGYQIGRMRIIDSDSWGSGEDDGSLLQLIHSGTVDAACDDCSVLDIVEDDNDELAIAVRQSEKGTVNFAVKPDGSVGIGTSSPTQELHVIGSINVSGTGNIYYEGDLTGYGADIAEMIYSVGKLEAGDVVVIDLENDETVRKSSEPYDTLVAGIVSTDPSHLISVDEGDIPLALSGRVPVKVSSINGPIARGDLLTTSNIPGVAMRCESANWCAGAIIGKALQSLDEGEGKITALIMLG